PATTSRASLPSYLAELNVPLLTHEGEIELGREIEAAQRRLLWALLQTPHAAHELRRAGRLLRQGRLKLDHVTAAPAEGDRELLRERTLRVLRRIDGLSTRRGDKAFKKLVKALIRLEPSPKLLETVVERLVPAYDELEASAHSNVADSGLEATFREIQRARLTIHRARSRLIEANLRLVVNIAK